MIYGILAFIVGIILGAILRGPPSDKEIDLKAENIKLRKENEVLWNRIQNGHNRGIRE